MSKLPDFPREIPFGPDRKSVGQLKQISLSLSGRVELNPTESRIEWPLTLELPKIQNDFVLYFVFFFSLFGHVCLTNNKPQSMAKRDQLCGRQFVINCIGYKQFLIIFIMPYAEKTKTFL